MSAPTTGGLTPDDEIHVVAFWTGIDLGVVRVGDLASTLIGKVGDGTDENARRLQDALLAGPFGPHGDALKLAAELGLSLRVVTTAWVDALDLSTVGDVELPRMVVVR